MNANDKLALWQDRLARSMAAWTPERERMDVREALYRGSDKLEAFTGKTKGLYDRAFHVRNIAAENIEAMVDTNIPQPKVTPRRKQDEKKAEIIENMIRGELDRLPMEEINDLLERMVPIQGGGLLLVEWDQSVRGHGTAGEVTVSAVHPKQLVPQDGVTGSIADMDYVILALPQTKGYIRLRYGVDVREAGEEKPELRTLDDEASAAAEMVTQYMAYYRGEDGAVGLFSWAGDTVLADYPDYSARRRRRCSACGEPVTAHTPRGADGALVCARCGGMEFACAPAGWEEIFDPIRSAHGVEIPGARQGVNEKGESVLIPTRIPAYTPKGYPLILQKNISVFGKLLGDSDIDKIADQQNALNWMQRKIDERLLDAGTIITLPPDVRAYRDPDDHKVYRVESPADAAMIGTYEFTGDLRWYYQQLDMDYEAARQILGITDSFQGRRDTTATSGTAKRFAAAQSAGRLESRRRMKEAAYARLFELIFQFRLAYADEPRPVISCGADGKTQYEAFDRYDFLEYDAESGQYYWNDAFLFSCDSAAPLPSNREGLWQEARVNFTSGAYGDPAQPETLLLYWAELERLHYPLAAATRKALEARFSNIGQRMTPGQSAARAVHREEQEIRREEEGT